MALNGKRVRLARATSLVQFSLFEFKKFEFATRSSLMKKNDGKLEL